MPDLDIQEHVVNGVRTAVWTAGSGEPLVCLHSAGSLTGIDWALPLSEGRRVIAPVHPGFGASDDDPTITSLHDYVLHYLDLFDSLGLDRFDLIGQSLGGQLAATFCIEHAYRVRRLVLVSPSGLDVPGAPGADLFSIPPDELPSRLTSVAEVLDRYVPTQLDVDFMVERYREASSLARFGWGGLIDRKLTKWAHRISPPTLVLWGEDDQLLPAAQATAWASLLPNATVELLAGYGHLLLDEGPAGIEHVLQFLARDASESTDSARPTATAR